MVICVIKINYKYLATILYNLFYWQLLLKNDIQGLLYFIYSLFSGTCNIFNTVYE